MTKRILPTYWKAVLWVFVLTLFPGPGVAAAEWEYDLTLYLLGAGLDGDVTVRGVTAEVDVGFSDLLGNLEFGIMGALEARKGRWAVHGDLIFVGLGATQDFERDFRSVRVEVTGDVDMDMSILEISGGWYADERLQLLFGARYTRLDGSAEVRTQNFGNFEGEDAQSWMDPLVGARVITPLGRRWRFLGRIDFAGFGIDAASTWNVVASFDFKATDRISVLFGYRLMDIDYEDGDGADEFAFDARISGPGAGVTIHF